jgi:glycine oxidase
MNAAWSVVLGGGLMGRLMAHQLAARGHRVDLYEAQGADAQGAAARVAAAMLAPLAESAITEPAVVRMGMHSIDRWQPLIAGLGSEVFFQRNGTLIIWHRQDAAEAKRFEQILQRTGRELPDLPGLQPLDAAQLSQIEPALAGRFQNGLYLPGEGQLDNRQLLQALLVDLQRQPAVQLHWHTSRCPADFQQTTGPKPDWLFDCRGLGAKPQLAQLRGVRGEVVRLKAPGVGLARPTRLVHPRYPIYIAPKTDDVYVIGATEIESEDASAPSVRSMLELLSAAYTVHPGFGEARILEINSQVRPTLPDNMPCLSELASNALQINGLYRHGFLIAPALLDAAVEWMEHGSQSLANRWGLRFENRS